MVKVVETGEVGEKFEYDDSTVVQYGLAETVPSATFKMFVFTGHGVDPWAALRRGGHAPASPHAHIVVIDPQVGSAV